MKLRIRGDSLRLRLEQHEVARLRDEGRIEQAVHFGPGDEARLVYAVVAEATLAEPVAELRARMIVVRLPGDRVRAWADGDDVGIESAQPLGAGRSLRLLVEKDFRCLAPRAGEDEGDGFPNPAASR
jgi:hypothetical protein